jgi:hypothetical protein
MVFLAPKPCRTLSPVWLFCGMYRNHHLWSVFVSIYGKPSGTVVFILRFNVKYFSSFICGNKIFHGHICLVHICLGFLRHSTDSNHKIQWQQAAYDAARGHLNFKAYDKLYPHLRHNGQFLFNYGGELAKAGYYKESSNLLDEAMLKVIDEKILCFQAENYTRLGAYERAEVCYLTACNIVPSRFYPKFFLFEFYEKIGKKNEAEKIGRTILEMPVKIPHEQVDIIREQVRISLDEMKRTAVSKI